MCFFEVNHLCKKTQVNKSTLTQGFFVEVCFFADNYFNCAFWRISMHSTRLSRHSNTHTSELRCDVHSNLKRRCARTFEIQNLAR